MSQQETDTADQQHADWDQWRDEIRTFYRRTIVELQRIVHVAVSRTPPTTKTPPAVTPSRPPRESTPTEQPSRSSNHDNDDSQDRLANLKRKLAAKISNQTNTADEPNVDIK